LFKVIVSIANHSQQHVSEKLFELIIESPKKCPSFPMPLLLEVMLEEVHNDKASKLIQRLIKHWMQDDATSYMQAFPVSANSPADVIEAQKRLIERVDWIFCDDLHPNTKTELFSLLLRSLTELSNVYKLVYLFCAPRHEDGFIDFDYYAQTHQTAGDETVFGDLVDALEMILKARTKLSFSHREAFMILEDLTTTPVMWSMHSFVKFLIACPELCVLSTYVRFIEGYHGDAASTFYYTIRANASSEFLATAVRGIMRNMPKNVASSFAEHVFRKSLQIISVCDADNKERLKMLRAAHQRVVDALNTGLSMFHLRCVVRSSSV